MPWLRVAPQRAGFSHKPVHVGFVTKWHWDIRYHSANSPHSLIHLITGAVQSQQITTPLSNTHTRVGTLIVATIYLQLIQNRYMFRSFTVLHCSHQHCVQPVASDVEVVGYL